MNPFLKTSDEHFGEELKVYNIHQSGDSEITDLKEKLWRAERALGLLEVILPDKVEQARKIAARLVCEATMGAEMWSLADGIERMKSEKLC